MLIGVSSNVLPRTRVQSLSFIFLAFISMKYSADFYDNIVSIQLIHDAVAFDTFADIVNSQLSIYINKQLSTIALEDVKDPYVKTIKDKFIFETHMIKCIMKMRKRQQVICVVIEKHAIDSINPRVMRIAKPLFACLHWENGLEAGSPYTDRLQRLTNRLLEAGMTQCLKKDSKLSDTAMVSSENDEFLTLMIFGFVLGAGYCVSIVAFLCECGRWKWKRATTRVRRFSAY